MVSMATGGGWLINMLRKAWLVVELLSQAQSTEWYLSGLGIAGSLVGLGRSSLERLDLVGIALIWSCSLWVCLQWTSVT